MRAEFAMSPGVNTATPNLKAEKTKLPLHRANGERVRLACEPANIKRQVEKTLGGRTDSLVNNQRAAIPPLEQTLRLNRVTHAVLMERSPESVDILGGSAQRHSGPRY